MPLVRRKRVLLHDVPETIAAEPAQSTREVFYVEKTGEIFTDYESYSARMLFYRMKIFQCELTGKGGLDYFQALESERSEAMTIHSRFPEQLKPPVLSAVQFQIMGRLDHLVELVYDRFVNRYFKGEKVFVDIQNEKYYARIIKVFPPKTLTNGASPSKEAQLVEPHSIGINLRVSFDESLLRDDPIAYFYAVRLIEETDPASGETKGDVDDDLESEKWAGSEMEVKANAMSRDRLSFSKSILRRFIRDCVDREPAVASPWTVKRAIAEKHGIATEMTEDIRMAINGAKQGEKEKRKKVWEDKHEAEGIPVSKRRKKDTPTPGGTPAEKPKPKGPIKYPIDDLDVTISERERKAGKAVVRPTFERDVPFGPAFEPFLMSWAFIQSFGAVLKLSTFTLDEFEMAIRHSLADVPCTLITEINIGLIAVAKERNPVKFIALDSLDFYDSQDREGEVPFAELTKAARSLGDRRASGMDTPVNKEFKSGWEEGLTIFIRDHATVDNLPSLRRILRSLLFTSDKDTSAASSSSDIVPTTFERAMPSERYPLLLSEDKIAIMGFLIEICLSSRAIRGHVDWADSALTELRKEKIEVNREKKRLAEEIAGIDARIEPEGEHPPPPETNGAQSSPAPPSSDVESEQRVNDDRSDITDEQPTGRRSRSAFARKASAKLQASQTPASKVAGHGKERAQARIKAQEMKNALAERRKLQDEQIKVDRRLEAIEREFRQLFGIGRARPMGKDRFFNRVWWLDGMGSGTLVASGGQTAYGTGRVFIQGPNEFDLPVLKERGDSFIRKRYEEEDGPEGTLKSGTWGYYSESQQMEEFIGWLNPKGHRELALRNQILKWSDHITLGMRKRATDITSRPERRSTRGRNSTSTGTSDVSRESYMAWMNRLSTSTTLAK